MGNPYDPYQQPPAGLPPGYPPPQQGHGYGPPQQPYGYGPPGPPQPSAESGRGLVFGAIACWVLAGLLFIAGGALYLWLASIADELGRRTSMPGTGGQLTEDDIELLTAVGVIGLVLGTVILVLGLLLLTRANWVRFAVAIVGVFGAFTCVGAIFVVPAIVLQFLPAANPWFHRGRT